MPELSERLCFTLEGELGVGEGGEAPAEVQLLPSGLVEPRGKTGFTVDDEAKRLILAAFEKSSTDLVVDYEHQSLSGSEAPAAGWIKEISDRGEGGLWGRVQWTERAREYLKGREYRYLSPVVLVRKKDGRAVELLGAALTNLPAIDGMAPVVNTVRPSPDGDKARREDGYREMFVEVLKLIGLPEGSGMDEVRARVSAMSDPAGFVPASEHEALREAVKAAEADYVIREALSDGRLTPSLLGWARAYAAVDMEGFRDFLKKACPVIPLGLRNEEGLLPVSREQRAVNRLLGIGDETFVRFGRALS